MDKVSKKQLEEVLKNGTPSDLYALIPAHARDRFTAFARCFGIKKEDIHRFPTWRKKEAAPA